jgi:hypothetical protein
VLVPPLFIRQYLSDKGQIFVGTDLRECILVWNYIIVIFIEFVFSECHKSETTLIKLKRVVFIKTDSRTVLIGPKSSGE